MKRISIVIVLVILCVTILFPTAVSAQEVDTREVSSVSLDASDVTISPRADVIVVKFRVYNVVLQFRRWNETWGYWVDPYWMNFV